MYVSPEKHAKALHTVYKTWTKARDYAEAMIAWSEVPASKAHYGAVAQVCAAHLLQEEEDAQPWYSDRRPDEPFI